MKFNGIFFWGSLIWRKGVSTAEDCIECERNIGTIYGTIVIILSRLAFHPKKIKHHNWCSPPIPWCVVYPNIYGPYPAIPTHCIPEFSLMVK